MTHDVSLPLNSTHYAMLYPQNGDRIVAIDSVTLLTSPYVDSGSSDVTVIYVHDTLAILWVLVGWRA